MKQALLICFLAFAASVFGSSRERSEETIPIVAVTAGARTDAERGADFVLCLVVFPEEKRDSGIQVYSLGESAKTNAFPVPENDAYISFELPAQFTVGLALLNPIEFQDLNDLRVLGHPPKVAPKYDRRFFNGPLAPTEDFSDGWGWPFSKYYHATVEVCALEVGKTYESYGVKTSGDEAEIVFERPEALVGRRTTVLLGDSANAKSIANEQLFRSVGNRIGFVLPEDLLIRLENNEADFFGLQEVFLLTDQSSDGQSEKRETGEMSEPKKKPASESDEE